MRILMLGWEFPPYIAGGLGVACYGLTKALDRLGHSVLFVMPRPIERGGALGSATVTVHPIPDGAGGAGGGAPEGAVAGEFARAKFRTVPVNLRSPYGGETVAASSEAMAPENAPLGAAMLESLGAGPGTVERASWGGPSIALVPVKRGGDHYSGDLLGDTERYARLVVSMARFEPFEVVHAHDWLTYPAGVAVSRVTGRQLVGW